MEYCQVSRHMYSLVLGTDTATFVSTLLTELCFVRVFMVSFLQRKYFFIVVYSVGGETLIPWHSGAYFVDFHFLGVFCERYL